MIGLYLERQRKKFTWFGLTDGLLWINVGKTVIYEYSHYDFNEYPNQNSYMILFIALEKKYIMQNY